MRFEKPTLAWLADRCYMALLVARLIELSVLSRTDEMEAFIVGVERWIQAPLDDVGMAIVEAKRDLGLRRYFLNLHHRKVGTVPKSDGLDVVRWNWQRDFGLVLGEIQDPWEIEVVWLADDDHAEAS